MQDDVSRLLSGRTIHYRNPNYDERDRPDEVYIDSVEEVSDWIFDGSSDFLGEGVILVNFEATVEVSVDDPDGGPYYDEDGGPNSSRMVTVGGAVTMSINQDDLRQFPAQSLGRPLLEAATVGIDELDQVSLVSRSH